MNKLTAIILLLLSFGCTHMLYQPSSVHYLEPLQFKLKYDDIFFQSKDGIKLHGWFFPASSSKPKGTIVHFHGNAQNISTHFLNLVWITKQDYNLFIFDYRGYGISEGESNQEGIYHDAMAALRQGKELHEQNGKGLFVIYGQSLGGNISLRALADYDQSQVDLIVQDSTFPSYQKIGADVLKRTWLTYIFNPLAYLLVSDEYASEKVMKKITTPTLVIVGGKDRVIPAKFGKKVYKGLSVEKKWLWDEPEAAHIQMFHGGLENYREKFVTFLEEFRQE